MIGYKYRANLKLDDNYRDTESLLKHEIYAPTFEKLNDPFEASFDDSISKTTVMLKAKYGVNTDEIDKHWRSIQDFKKTLGIYSFELKTDTMTFPTNELLWAHYANSHKGFCIEYDVDKLISSNEHFYEINRIDILYQNECPIISINDIAESNTILQKMFGTKSFAWTYENEIRLIYETSSEKPYHPSSLKSIYFGLNMDLQEQNNIITGLENHDVCFYKMEKIKNTYQLKATLICENKRLIKNRLNNSDYKVMKTNHNPTVENFHVLLLTKNREQSFLLNFVTKFREEYASKKSNIWLYDDEQIYDLIGKYPLYGAEKDIFANHLIAGSTFDAPDNIWLYPDK